MECPNILDFEASGFGSFSYPIEVGFCLANGERFCSLIKPAPDWQHWDFSAEQVHGIDREMLLEFGQDVREVCKDLNKRLRGLTLYSDGWVVDKSWCDRLFEAARLAPSFHLSPIENIQSECQHFMWDKVRKQLIRETHQVRHRASADAQFIQELYVRTSSLCEKSRAQCEQSSSV